MRGVKYTRKKYFLSLVLIALCVFFDQYTKDLAVIHLKNKPSIVLWEGVFQLEYLENTGAAFGLFKGRQLFFCLIFLIITIISLNVYSRLPGEARYSKLRICICLVISGGLGNLIDRIRLGYVIDFLYFKLIDFPVFNVADIFVTVSTLILIYLLFFFYKEEELERIFHHNGIG